MPVSTTISSTLSNCNYCPIIRALQILLIRCHFSFSYMKGIQMTSEKRNATSLSFDIPSSQYPINREKGKEKICRKDLVLPFFS